ncbi:MAG: FkbM family methyltransferase [Candidatus Dormiibacterota bacterium]
MVEKILALLTTVRDWYKVPFDKALGGYVFKYHMRRGSVFYCRTKTTDINEVVAVYSRREYPGWPEELRTNEPVWDVGANIGAFTVLAAAELGSDREFLSIEPAPDNLRILYENLGANGLPLNWVCEAAVGPHTGKGWLTTGRAPDAYRLTQEPTGVAVRVVTLDELAGISRTPVVGLLKLDCEGSEYDALDGSGDFLRRCVRHIFVEVHQRGHDGESGGRAWVERWAGDNFACVAWRENILHLRNLRLRQ